ncbi:putative glucose-6-phosphate 1-epimerase [Tanacetum coccineum]
MTLRVNGKRSAALEFDKYTLEQHGFARNRLWTLDEDPSPLPAVNSQSNADLLIKSTEEDLKTWPFRKFVHYIFELRIRITVSAGKLTLVPRVRNVDNKAFTFTLSLRNYFSVSDVSEVRVEGLETLDYLDNTLKRERYTEQADAITFDGEDKKAKAILDLGDEDYNTMLCLDAAAVENPINIKPCEEWRGRQELSIVSSSYYSGQLDPHKVINGLR